MTVEVNCRFGLCRLCLLLLGKWCWRPGQQFNTLGSTYFGIFDGRHTLNLGAILALWQRIGRVAVEIKDYTVNVHFVVLQFDFIILACLFRFPNLIVSSIN